MKRILTTLFALAIVLAGSMSALAAEMDTGTGQDTSYYPISVEEYTYGETEEPRINKVYQLSLSDDPSGIPTEDFVRNGRRYFLLDMTRKNEVGVDTKPYIETVTQASSTDDMETILQQLSAEHGSAPTSMREYEIGGKRYIVTSHYAGEKEIDSTIRSISIDRAKREMGIA